MNRRAASFGPNITARARVRAGAATGFHEIVETAQPGTAAVIGRIVTLPSEYCGSKSRCTPAVDCAETVENGASARLRYVGERSQPVTAAARLVPEKRKSHRHRTDNIPRRRGSLHSAEHLIRGEVRHGIGEPATP